MKTVVLLATFNGEPYLSAQLDSLLNQTYSHFEIFISDDCSTDGTQKIIDEYVQKYPERIHDIHNSQRFGCAQNNFFNLVENVTADFYFFCDQDDVWCADKIQKVLKLYQSLENQNQPILIHTDLKVTDKNLNVLNDSFFEQMQLKKNITSWKGFVVQNYVTGCAMAINNSLADIYRIHKASINKDNILMHDYFFALLAVFLGKILFIDDSEILYRQHGNNSVGAKNVKSFSYAINKLKTNGLKNKEIVSGRNQLGEILKILKAENFDHEVVFILEEYCNLVKKNKFARIRFIKTNGFCKIGLKRKIYQFLTI